MRWHVGAASAAAVAAVAAHDLLQRRHALLRNFPVLGHARFWLEAIGPELRQYIVAGNDGERPFSRDQRRWVYASSKLENNYFGFGTDNDVEHTAGYPIIKHRTFGRAVPRSAPTAGQEAWLPGAKVLGAARGRRGAFQRYQGSDGTELFDVPGRVLPDEHVPARPRLLGMWDAPCSPTPTAAASCRPTCART